MKNRKLKIKSLKLTGGVILFFLFLPLIPSQVQAFCEGPIVPCGRVGTPACQFCHIFILFNNIVDYILTCLTPITAGLMIIIGGFYLLIAGGSPTLFSKAKSIVTAVVIGLVIIMTSWIFLNTFFTYIGVATWTGLGTWWQITCP